MIQNLQELNEELLQEADKQGKRQRRTEEYEVAKKQNAEFQKQNAALLTQLQAAQQRIAALEAVNADLRNSQL